MSAAAWRSMAVSSTRSTGRGEMVALDAAAGTLNWRQPLGAPARSAPTVADGRLFVSTIEQQLLALATPDGHRLWMYPGLQCRDQLLGPPAPAYSAGLVVAGFGSGDLVGGAGDQWRPWCGPTAWQRRRDAPAWPILSAIRGLPVISDGRVSAIGLGGLLVALDLRSGRRLWEREVAGRTVAMAGRGLAVRRVHRPDLGGAERARWAGGLGCRSAALRERAEAAGMRSSGSGRCWPATGWCVAGTNERALAVSPYTGEILGQQKLSGAASLGPVVAGGTVFFVTDDGP